jgi:hypothetical protein
MAHSHSCGYLTFRPKHVLWLLLFIFIIIIIYIYNQKHSDLEFIIKRLIALQRAFKTNLYTPYFLFGYHRFEQLDTVFVAPANQTQAGPSLFRSSV